MIQLLFLGLAASVLANNVATVNLHTAARKLQSFHREKPNFPRAPVALQEANLTKCFEAWVQLDAVLSSSCGDITAIYSPNLTGVDVTSYVTAQCVTRDPTNNLTCQQKVSGAIAVFAAFCNDIPSVMDGVARAELNMWLTIAQVPCIQDNNNYCFPIFRQNMDSFQTALENNATVNDALLNQLCIPCVIKVIDSLATWGIKDFVSASADVKIACTKINNKYCLPIVENIFSSPHSWNTSSDLDLICADCTRVITYRTYLANLMLGADANLTQRADLQAYLSYAGFVCSKNEKDQYCLLELQSYDYSPMQTACQSPAVLTACPGSQCQTEIMNFKNKVGCCFGTWFNYLEYTFVNHPQQYDLDQPPATLKLLVQNLCQVNIPISCATKKLAVTFTVTNILQSWYQSRKAWFETQFRQIVAYIISINPTLVVALSSSYDSTNMAVLVSVNVSGFVDGDVYKYEKLLNDALSANAANDVIVNIKDDQGNGTQCTSLDQPITVSAQSVVTCSDASTCKTNFASALAPSFSLLFLLAILLAFSISQ